MKFLFTAWCFTAFTIIFCVSTANAQLNTNNHLSSQWVKTGEPDSSAGRIKGLTVQGQTLFAATYWNGVYSSDNSGMSWKECSPGMLKTLTCITSNGSTLFAGTLGGVYKDVKTGIISSTDNGTTWNPAAPTVPYECLSIASNGGIVYAGTKGGFCRSTDNGATWQWMNSGITLYSFIYAFAFEDTTIYAAGVSTIAKTTDNGKTWTDLSSTASLTSPVVSLVKSGDVMIVGTESDYIRISTDKGATWKRKGNAEGMDSPYIRQLLAGGNYILAAGSNGVLASADSGKHWTNTSSGLFLPASLVVFGSNVYAGSMDNGVWTLPLSQITAVNETGSQSLPESFALLQNFPNPFNPTTTISFIIPAAQPCEGSKPSQGFHTTLKVYDAVGREVATLVNEVKEAGSYTVQFDASKLSSGIYFYRIQARPINGGQAGKFSAVKKSMLVK